MKLLTTVMLLAASGTTLAGSKDPCMIPLLLPMHDNATTWTLSMVIAAACLVVVLTARLVRNKSHT